MTIDGAIRAVPDLGSLLSTSITKALGTIHRTMWAINKKNKAKGNCYNNQLAMLTRVA